MFSDSFKLVGGRWFIGAMRDDCSPLGCWQSGSGSVFGRAHPPGGLIDAITESFAGPHDKANSFWWYVNTPAQVARGLGMIGDALPYDYCSPLTTRVLEYATNYTTSLAFALPFASAAILEQSWSTQSVFARRRFP